MCKVSLAVDGQIAGNGGSGGRARLRVGQVGIMPLQVSGQLPLRNPTLHHDVTRLVIDLDDVVHSLQVKKHSPFKRDSETRQGQTTTQRHDGNPFLVCELNDLLDVFRGAWRYRIVRSVWFCSPEVPRIDEKLFRLT